MKPSFFWDFSYGTYENLTCLPQYVVEFVMYHELLHKQHGQKWGKSRLLVHTPEFRQDERKFKQYEQAKRWLEKLARTH